MIYFTEISKDSTGDQSKSELVAFQFYLKELPESIKTPWETKVNRIEYNGGFITNQIIGIYQKEIEWEGCFYGTYTKPDGTRYSAKERADEIKKFMGRPIRVGFAVPTGSDKFIPGESPTSNNLIGKDSKDLKGEVGVFIITEYEPEIVNYSDVNYRIKIVPHMRQEKIKPTETTQKAAVKLATEEVTNASNNINKAVPKPSKGPFRKAPAQAAKAKRHAEQLGPQQKPGVSRPQSTENTIAQNRRNGRIGGSEKPVNGGKTKKTVKPQ